MTDGKRTYQQKKLVKQLAEYTGSTVESLNGGWFKVSGSRPVQGLGSVIGKLYLRAQLLERRILEKEKARASSCSRG